MRHANKILFGTVLTALLAVGAVLLSIAWDHKGFFEYQYTLRTSEEFASYQEELVRLAASDPTQAFIRFNETLEEDPLSYNNCHGVAHQMGHAAYESFGFQGAMEAQNAICGGGYIHGVIEARFGLLQEHEIFAVLPELCEVGSNTCYHGVGHGLMIATDLDIDASLEHCDVLPGVGARNCYDGVWMHIFDLEESGARDVKDTTRLLNPEDIEEAIAACARPDDRYKSSCYFYLPRIYAHSEEIAFESYVELCESVEESYRVSCAAGSGHTIMKYHINDPDTSMSRCESYVADGLTGACKEGGSLYYLHSSETSTGEVSDLSILCEDFSREDDRDVCEKVNVYRGTL